MAHHHHIGPQVETDQVIEVLLGDILQRERDVYACVIDQQVKPTKAFDRLLKELSRRVRFGKVRGIISGLRTALVKQRYCCFDCRFHILGSGIIGEYNVIALLRQNLADAPTHTDCGAGYNRFFSFHRII
jgi:hypothetical protein